MNRPMPKTSVQAIFQQFKQQTILVIGDVMVDAYLWGKVDRISPEAPVPVVHTNSRDSRLGGAANVALNLKALGAKPILCSVIGADASATTLLQVMQKEGLDTSGILEHESRITTVKERIMSGSHHLLRIDHETTEPLNDACNQLIWAYISGILP